LARLARELPAALSCNLGIIANNIIALTIARAITLPVDFAIITKNRTQFHVITYNNCKACMNGYAIFQAIY